MAETAEKTTLPNRTQIPNIVDDLGLDPYERALYVHYKRVCGENPGAYCYEATKTTAQKTKMSTGQVSMARKSLGLRGLISIQAETRPVVVTVVNIWELNTKFYLLENRPEIDGWDVEQIKRWLYDMSTDVHTVNLSSHNDSDIRSPYEPNLTEQVKDVHHMNVDNNGLSYVHTVKQRSKESLIIESNPSIESKRGVAPLENSNGLAPHTQALMTICKLDWEFVKGDKPALGAFNRIRDFLIKKGATTADIAEFDLWRRTHHWTGNSPPTLKQVGEYWPQYQEWVTQGRPEAVEKNNQNGANQNGNHQGKRTQQFTGDTPPAGIADSTWQRLKAKSPG